MKKSKHKRRRRPPIGASPGTLVVPEGSPAPRLRAMHYTAETLHEVGIASLGELDGLTRQGGFLWLDVHGLGDERVIRAIGERFELHRLEVEDVVHVHQRPKIEPYEKHLFLVASMIRMVDGAMDIEQLSLFVGADFVLTFQEREGNGDVLDPVRERVRQAKGTIRRSMPCYLAYAILDAIVDAYFPVMDEIGTRLEGLEDAVLERQRPEMLRELNEIRAHLLKLRRIVSSQRDALLSMTKEPLSFVTDDVRLYLRDVADHCVQIADLIEAQREIGAGLLNTYLTLIANRTNDVMKVLTIIATIFIPLTFLVGVYGMNFEYMPELEWPWAYPALLAIMLAMGLAMVAYFRRKGWMG
jgi:magnesium transporter